MATLRVVETFDYHLPDDVNERIRIYGTPDANECARLDGLNPPNELKKALGTRILRNSYSVTVLSEFNVRTFGKRVEAQVAESTVSGQIERSRLDLELKREELRKLKLANDLAERRLIAAQRKNERNNS